MHKALAIAALLVFAQLAHAEAPLVRAESGPPIVGDVAVQSISAGQRIRFTLITLHGYVGFDAGHDWGVVAMQSSPPVTGSAFQIPDPSDEGTSDSTNIVVSLYQPDSAVAKKAMAIIGRKRGDTEVTVEHHKAWTVYRQTAMQGDTLYTVLDAKAPVADVICGVRLAWPHLKAHAADYDARMERLFADMLDSIQGGMGTYPLHAHETLRRPER